MRLRALGFLLWISVALSAAHADECDVILGMLVQSVPGVVFVAYREGSYRLRHKEASSLYFVCFTDTRFVDLRIKSNGPSPPASYFVLISQAGSVITGEPDAKVRRAAETCHRNAMKQPASKLTGDRLDNTKSGKARISCAVSTDTDGVTYMIVSKTLKHSPRRRGPASLPRMGMNGGRHRLR